MNPRLPHAGRMTSAGGSSIPPPGKTKGQQTAARFPSRQQRRHHMIRTKILWQLDRWFPPDASANMCGDQQTDAELKKAAGSIGGYLEELGRSDVDVLDFGCGWGGETLWLAERVRSVAGYDVEASSIVQAERMLRKSGLTNCTFASSPDGMLPFGDNSFDAVFSTDTFEHVMDLDLAFREIHRVLRPGGLALSRFGPLFHSPFGYHLYWACRVPYAHLLFGLPSILELRQARSGKKVEASSWQQMGLNEKRFADFKQATERAGFVLERFQPIPVLGLKPVAFVPLLGDLFTFGVDFRIRKRVLSKREAPAGERERAIC
jgi:ubiquinone/menaquinone biosynthesis C-methylase UbiE